MKPLSHNRQLHDVCEEFITTFYVNKEYQTMLSVIARNKLHCTVVIMYLYFIFNFWYDQNQIKRETFFLISLYYVELDIFDIMASGLKVECLVYLFGKQWKQIQEINLLMIIK